jgi:mannose-1-phosphate guanylyltransferase/mannose-6-phosphate isomerase
MSDQSLIYPVILSGGAGTRLWPISRRDFPKQFIPLLNEKSPLQDTALRVSGEGHSSPSVICSAAHRFLVAEQMAQIGVHPKNIILEPVGRNTCPAAAVAALMVRDLEPRGLVLLLPSDHLVEEPDAFRRAIERAKSIAEKGYLVTFGVKPTQPETGYGYIKVGSELSDGGGGHHVDRFTEKPTPPQASEYLASGDYAWNSGIFLFRADRMLEELGRHAPDVLTAAVGSWEKALTDLDFVRLAGEAFETAPSISLDYAIMEKTDCAAVIPVEMGWSDLGTWDALWAIAERDEDGNACRGDVLAVDTHGSYLRTDGPVMAVLGLENVIAIAADDALLIASKDRAQEVNAIVKAFDETGSNKHISHTTVYRPWGSFKEIEIGERYQVKQITVKPGARLSLQVHQHRAEHWIVVRGTAKVTRGDEDFLLCENESTYIPQMTKHLIIIEVQSGSYLGEDDIIRLEDTYGRQGTDD